MLSSTFAQWRAIDLQVPDTGERESDQSPQIILLDKTGSMKLHGSTFSIPHYSTLTVGNLSMFESERPLAIRPESSTSVQTLIAAIESLKGIGLTRVALGNSVPEKTGQAGHHD